MGSSCLSFRVFHFRNYRAAFLYAENLAHIGSALLVHEIQIKFNRYSQTEFVVHKRNGIIPQHTVSLRTATSVRNIFRYSEYLMDPI